MPFLALLHLVIAIGFALHAHRTGRPQFWFYILLFVPLAGSLAYVAFELLPEMANTRRARKVATDVRTLVDPDRDFRILSERVMQADTIEAKCNLAEECERKGMWTEAIEMYRRSAQGIYAEDKNLLRGLARALLGSGDPQAAISTLERLRADDPDYHHQDAHLTYARALEAQGKLHEAAQEYEALANYYVGLEARTRWAILLMRLGDPSRARRLFDEVVRAGKAKGLVLTQADHDWVRVARKNLQ